MQLRDVELPSNRKFGTFMALAFGLTATLLVHSGQYFGASFAGLAGIGFALLAWLNPDRLIFLNRAWMMLGLLLGAIVNPIVMAILFFGLFTPMAIVLRILGRDELRLRQTSSHASHWRERTSPEIDPTSFTRQY